jgi:hypothetical protein
MEGIETTMATRSGPTQRGASGERSRRGPDPGWLRLSAPLAALVALASAAGVFSAGTYERDAGDFAAQGRAQDHVTLFVAVPALLVT